MDAPALEERAAGGVAQAERATRHSVARDALRAGVRKVWFHRGAGAGAATPAAIALCRANGVEPVHDLCPFMVLTGTALPHRVHAFFRRRLGHARVAPATAQ